MEKKLLERFTKTHFKKQKQKLKIEKVMKKKGEKLYVQKKGCNNSFTSWIDKKRHNIDKWMFQKPNSLKVNVKFELDLSNHTTKKDLKNVTGFDTSPLAEKIYLANSKSDVDKLDIDELK